ncbi:hypothetical protein ACQPYH_25645 [Kribbella sp. CA-245084]|uniref:hypothetical protein n=1 Tax=Kribbella sp. CA-245084 TaxID=3239940 RepID=UPI003D90CA94
MNEEDLNEAFHDVIVRSRPPESMDPGRVLEQARRARKRRQVTWAGATVAALVVVAGAGPVLIANYAGNRSTGPMVAGVTTTPQPPSTSTPVTTTPSPVGTVAPKTRKSNDPWPEGQVDRTATTGPRAERAVTLMNDLSSAVPAGFSQPNLKFPDGRSMRWPQSQYASNDGEQDYWEYAATIPVQKGDRVGQVFAQSTTPDGKPATTPCKLAQRFWGGTGACSVMDVGGKKVGVLTTNGKGSYDQWAAYRYADGTVVFVAQAKKSDQSGRSPLTQPVFTGRQLAELATSAKFKISA